MSKHLADLLQRKYETIVVSWEEDNTSSTLTLHNKNLAQAYDDAVFLGFKPSSKWKFWGRNCTYVSASDESGNWVRFKVYSADEWKQL